MAISQSQLDTELEAVKTAIDADDYPSARKWLFKAKVTLSGLANTMVGSRQVMYRETISGLSDDLDSLESVSSNSNKNRRVFGRYLRS